jgi:hypothetical protein
MAVKIKQEFKETVIGFNNSCSPLGERNDLHILAEIAKANKRQDYLGMFEETEETEKEKTERFNAKQGDKHNSE